MPEPVSMLALGVAIGKLLLRWADLNDTADALEDAHAGFNVLKVLGSKKATDPVSTAVTDLLEQRLTGVRDEDRREQMKIAVLNVAGVFTGLTDADIVAAAQHPLGFPDYLAAGPGRTLLANTEEALTPFTRQVMDAGAEVFAELAPRSGRFAAGALLRLLDRVDTVGADVSGLHEDLRAARDELAASIDRVADGVDALHPKIDQVLDLIERAHLNGDVVAASCWATDQGIVLGPPLAGWEPERLGVHASITVHEETVLTPYISREHDSRLRDLLTRLRQPGSRAALLLVSGTSCTGKTRTLYEAVLDVLDDWPLVAPRNDTELTELLRAGIPNDTVVWLDEIQRHLTKTDDGIRAANAIAKLIGSDQVGPILFAGTIWPTNLTTLLGRPTPDEGAKGADAITDLLRGAPVIPVPEVFSDLDLDHAREANDPRLTKAIDTATPTTDADQGRKITQVLAGGTQLVNRLHPPPGNAPLDKFSPSASAVLNAAGDLRRIGMPNPLPRWAIEGAAPGYLKQVARRPAHIWLTAALDETTQDADDDDAITGHQSLDVHAKGVPALTPHLTIGSAGQEVEAYDLHDYLYQDHLTRHRATPTRPQLWDALTNHHQHLDNPQSFATAAQDRGLLTTAIDLLRPTAGAGAFRAQPDGQGEAFDGDLFAQYTLASLLGIRGDETALTELRTRADAGDRAAQEEFAGLLATRGDDAALTELRTRADAGDQSAQDRLAQFLADRGDDAALIELRTRADAGDWYAVQLLAGLLAARGDETALIELRTRADTGDGWAQLMLATLLATRGDETALTELRNRAGTGDWAAHEKLTELLAARGDETALTELRTRADAGDQSAQDRLARLLAARSDETALIELRALVLAGRGGLTLLGAYRRRSPDRYIAELNCEARPVYTDPP